MNDSEQNEAKTHIMLKSGPFSVLILPITQFEWIENKIEQVL